MARYDNFKEDALIWNKKVFPNQLSQDEDIVLVVREDILIIAFRAISYLLAFFILLALKLLTASVGNAALSSFFDLVFYTFSSILLLVFAYNFHNYYLSLQIITSRRLIDIDQVGLFNREVNELAIEKIEDVTYRQDGVLQSVFGYGTVSVQTAAEINTDKNNHNSGITGGFVFQNVPAPAEIHAIITNLYHENRQQETIRQAQIQGQYLNKALGEKNF